MPASPRRRLTKSPAATGFDVTGDLQRRGRVVTWVGGGMGWVSSGWEVDHGGLSGGAQCEELRGSGGRAGATSRPAALRGAIRYSDRSST